MSSHRRRRLGVGLVSLSLCSVAAAGWVVHKTLTARSELTTAQASLTGAKDALLQQRQPQAAQALAVAGVHTERAVRATSDPLFRLVAAVPVAGRSLAVIEGVAAEADGAARQVLPPVVAAAQGLRPEMVRRRDGSIDLARLHAASGPLTTAGDRLAMLVDRHQQLPRDGVLGPVQRASAAFGEELESLHEAVSGAATAVRLGPALLGEDRPRRYFVLVQQTSESRGTGGLPGGYAIVTASGGVLRVTAQGSNADLKDGAVVVPPGVGSDYVDLYGPNGAFDIWRNVNLSPDLPSVARVIAARWEQQGGEAIDGVITLDALALADLLRSSGSLTSGGRQIRPQDLPDYLALGQYRELDPLGPRSVRKEELSRVSGVVLDRLTSGAGGSADLLRGLTAAVRSGHLRMASDDPALDGLSAAGVDGALPAGRGPVAYPVVFNSSGGKLDYFLARSVSYTAGACTATRRTSRIAVTLENRAPASGLPPYVTISVNAGKQTNSYDNAVTLSIYATRGARFSSATLDGRPVGLAPTSSGGTYLSAASEQGLPLWSVFLTLPRGKARQLVLTLDEPTAVGPARIPEQPLATPLVARSAAPVCE